MAERLLPEDFHDLESLAARWSLATEKERSRQRRASTMEEIQAFYQAVFPRMEAIMEHLNALPLDAMSAEARRLLDLTLSLAEVAPAVELFKQPTVIDGYDPERFAPQRGQ